jgi:hypothetical protein
MTSWFIAGYAVFSAFLCWRLVTVVATSTDKKHRHDAIRMFGYIWSGSTLGTGLFAGVIRLHELGLLDW